MVTQRAPTRDHHDRRHRTVGQEPTATAEAAGNLLEKEGERPMVKRKIATDIDVTVVALAGTATEEVTVTKARNGAGGFRHHSDATILRTGRCLTRIGSERGKRSRPPSAKNGG